MIKQTAMVIPVFHSQINALAGSCHTNASLHYSGMAVDLQLNWSGTSRDPNQTKAYQDACTEAGGWKHNGTHVHCSIGLIWHYFEYPLKSFLQFLLNMHVPTSLHSKSLDVFQQMIVSCGNIHIGLTESHTLRKPTIFIKSVRFGFLDSFLDEQNNLYSQCL